MPFITVWNFEEGNEGFNFGRDARLLASLKKACLSVSELNLEHDNDVTANMAGRYPYSGHAAKDDPLIIIVELLFDKPERTFEVRQKLAKVLGDATKLFVGDRTVEVAIKRFNPERDAFWRG